MTAVILSIRQNGHGRSWQRPVKSSSALNLTQALSSEIIRKLIMATEKISKQDAETVCEDVFLDIIGSVERRVRAALETDQPCCFYEILADHYTQHWTEGEQLFSVCRRMWSQSFVVPIYSLLLHKWILENHQAGGESEKHKHLNILLTGCQQLFWTDLVSCTYHFTRLFDFLYKTFINEQADCKISNDHIQRSFWSLLAQFMPYYLPLEKLSVAIMEFPVQKSAGFKKDGSSSLMRDLDFTSDEFFTQITDTLRKFGGKDPGLVIYLKALAQFKDCPLLSQLRTVTSLRLQAQLYSLTSQGGPRYVSWKVRTAAFEALDALYPSGSRTRKLISQLFRILHPLDWPRTTASVVRRAWKNWVSILMLVISGIWIFLTFPFKKSKQAHC